MDRIRYPRLGRILYNAIMSAGMTQKEVAHAAGVTEVSISHYVKGQRLPRADVLLWFWRHLDVPMYDIYCAIMNEKEGDYADD